MSGVPSTRRERGLESEELRLALDAALRGARGRLEALLARHSGMPGPRPNLPLAEALGESLTLHEPRAALALLDALSADDAAPDDPRVFLPIVAAYGYVALLRAERASAEQAWARLGPLAGDERAPVRRATSQALASLALRERHGGDRLVAAMSGWLLEGPSQIEDVELRWGAIATLLDALTQDRALSSVGERARLLSLVSRWIEELVDAPRAAERWDARRRAFVSLSLAASSFVREIRGGDEGARWLEQECARARHPDLRRALEASLERLSKRAASERAETLARLAQALASSQKPPRDPTLERRGTRRRGR